MSASRNTTNTMSAIEKNDVNFKRKVHTRFFSDGNLQAIEPRLCEKVHDFLQLLTPDVHTPAASASGWGSTIDMSTVCNWLTFDVITDLCYGKALGMLKSPDNRWFFSAIRAMSWRGMMVSFILVHNTDYFSAYFPTVRHSAQGL